MFVESHTNVQKIKWKKTEDSQQHLFECEVMRIYHEAQIICFFTYYMLYTPEVCGGQIG